jgi:hypothetical protein
MVGDYVTYAGVLSPSPDFDFAAYEIVGNLGIFTQVSSGALAAFLPHDAKCH